jgi:hypothetical protein
VIPKQSIGIGVILTGLLTLLLTCGASFRRSDVMSPTLTPTPDRLAEPVLPENPTQYEQGRHLYWMNCMPCHGDKGQGLTNEFRSLWVEDHQNCWARGCHAGHAEDEGFPLPRTIPAIISTTGDALVPETADQLLEYLRSTHPPQHPGYLPEEEYWAISAYLLIENKRLAGGQEIGPRAQVSGPGNIWKIAAIGLGSLVVMIIVWLFLRRKKPEPD